MTIPGPTVHQQLMDAYKRLTEQLEQDRQGMHDVRQEYEQLDAKRDDALRSLAEHYLPELTADAVASTWREVQAKITTLLLQKEDEDRSLQQELKRLQEHRTVTEKALVDATNVLDAAILQQNEVSAVVEKRLQEDTQFVELADRAAIAEVALERAESNLHEIDQDAARKLPSYQASTLFQYLYERGYGEKGYRSRGLTRRIDRWLARYIDYTKARQGYDFLKQTPDQMRKIIAEDRRSLNIVMEELERKRDRVANELGLPERISLTERFTKDRQQSLQTANFISESMNETEDRIRDLSDPRGSYYKQAIELFRQILVGFKSSDLKRRAEATKNDLTDDQIVARLSGVESDRGDLQEATRDRRNVQKQKQDIIEELGRVIQRFRAAHFDSARSHFLAKLRIDEELRYTEDAEDARKLWQKIRRAQRWGDHESEEDAGGSSLKQVLVNAMGKAAGDERGDDARRAGSRRMEYDSASDVHSAVGNFAADSSGDHSR
ncbi:MAG: hypothetical protein CMM01_13725 [Rhodopirellula sp.]|nr:hypothetical protein [Rhodopirellula sp.]MAI71957.1 hypothetical protein [Rhodopirellula sp.]OUX50814.1 MAG: hypothetical protein CBE43_06185 [Rhodopirellula sp. TMED283]